MLLEYERLKSEGGDKIKYNKETVREICTVCAVV